MRFMHKWTLSFVPNCTRMPSPPQPHGLPHNFEISDTQFEAWKLNKIFADVPVEQWTDLERLCDQVLTCCPHITTSSKARSLIKKTLTNTSSKLFDTSLKLYCERIKSFLNKTPIIHEFDSTWQHAFEKATLRATIERRKETNTLKADLAGEDMVAISLDQRIMSQSTNQSSVGSTASVSPSSSADILMPPHAVSAFKPVALQDILGLHASTSSGKDVSTTQNSLMSISTNLDHAGKALHDRYNHGVPLTSMERCVMSACLSSIVDFVDGDPNGQEALWGKSKWDEMRQHFLKKYTMPEEPKLPKTIQAAWDHVVRICKERNEAESRSFIAKELDRHRDPEVIIGLETIQQLLIAFRRHHLLLDPLRISPPPEYDLAFKLWLPIFDCLFAGDSLLSTRIAETVNDYTSSQKPSMYARSDHRTTGFKIDIRFLFVDRHGHQEVDVCAAEAAKNSMDDDKLADDHSKLLREGKDILDRLLEMVVERHAAANLKGYFIQLGGTQGQLSSIHLDDETGIYVAIPQERLLFPASAASIGRFETTFAALLRLRRDLRKMTTTIQQQQELLDEKRRSLGSSRSRPAPVILAHPLKKSKSQPGARHPMMIPLSHKDPNNWKKRAKYMIYFQRDNCYTKHAYIIVGKCIYIAEANGFLALAASERAISGQS